MIQYVTRKKTSPKTGESKYYAQMAPVLPVSQDELASYINDQTTVSKTDIKAILVALDNALIHYLKLGLSVRLGDVGSFRPTLSSKGETNADSVTAESVKAVRARYTMGSVLRKALKPENLQIQKFTVPTVAE